MVVLTKIIRRDTHQVKVGNVWIGSEHPVLIQSMTNTDTVDVESTVKQVIELTDAGSEMVRITVNNDEAAKAVPYIKEKLLQLARDVPLVGCFHYNGHILLSENPGCAAALSKYRINPGNVGFGYKKDRNFEMMVACAISYDKSIRIGVNWGSVDQEMLKALMDENASLQAPKQADEVMREALVISALSSSKKAEDLGLPKNKIVVSAKVSRVQDLIAVYQALAARSEYPLHLGLTEAGPGTRGIVATSAALSILLQRGIGDTVRASLTPAPGAPRSLEVKVCEEIMQAIGIRSFTPQVIACPGCGRTSSSYFQELAINISDYIKDNMKLWRQLYPGIESLNIAVMGCIVNGPGESKHADIGISLPGSGENPVAPVFIDGVKACTLRGDNIAAEFKSILTNYIKERYVTH